VCLEKWRSAGGSSNPFLRGEFVVFAGVLRKGAKTWCFCGEFVALCW
jgi:hypothetical protein